MSDRFTVVEPIAVADGRGHHRISEDDGSNMDDGMTIEGSLSTPERFAEIFDRHYVALYAFCARRVGSVLADDIVNETFCVAFDRRSSYATRERPNARPWLMGIAINVMRHDFRRRLREARAFGRLGGAESYPDHDSAVLNDFEAIRRMNLVRAALAKVPDQELEALLLSVLDGHTYGQIAEVLQIPIGTVRSRIHRARRHLSDLLVASEASLQSKNKEG
jgi:RNA polymerase sigma factor (sigma-70 family)